MSSQPVPAAAPATPQLSAEYKRVQKVYVLVSAALFFWRLFGANVDLSKLGLSLPSADAGPYILGIALLYLCYKFIIEWKESDAKSREKTASRIDFWVTHGVALGSILMVVQQRLAIAKIGASVSRHSGWVMFLTFVALLLTSLLLIWYTTLKKSWMKTIGAIPVLAMSATAVGLLIYTARVRGPVSASLALILGIAPLLAIAVAVGVFLVVITVLSIVGASRLAAGDSEDNPGASPFDVLGQ
jgi:hypothetical protein